ncbi:MAG: PhnD/SsuA/transferrin family substrate-binding protein, partial [Anaerolineaceae bacterium]|nr:PhnD/SsuA/transferrin family substrate-binding protein [Anaerolineaceae bacterium]
ALFFQVILILMVVSFSGCAAPTPTKEVTTDPTPTIEVFPLGSDKNPIIIGYVSPDSSPIAEDKLERVSSLLSADSGLSIKFQVFSSAKKLLSGITNQQIHSAWLYPATYIYAHNKDLVTVRLLTNHFGSYFYGSQFLANSGDNFRSYFDSNAGTNNAEPQDALKQFDDKTPCFVEKTSLSGYVVALGLLKKNQVETRAFALLKTPTAVVRALYIKGICDFGVTYTYIGDPRTSNTVINDLSDAMTRIVIIFKSDSVIPMLNFSVSNKLQKDIAETLQQSMGDLIETTDGKDLLSEMLGYDIEDSKVVDDSVYDPLRGLITASGVPIEELIGW